MSPKFQSILIGGFLSAVIAVFISVAGEITGATDPQNSQSFLGIVINILGCMVMLSSGLISVWHYTTENKLTLTGGEGAGIGVLSGLVYAVGALALSYLLVAVGILPSPDEALQRVRDTGAFDEAGGEQAESITQMMLTWGIPVFVTIGGAILGLIGGLIGAALFKRGSDDDE